MVVWMVEHLVEKMVVRTADWKVVLMAGPMVGRLAVTMVGRLAGRWVVQ